MKYTYYKHISGDIFRRSIQDGEFIIELYGYPTNPFSAAFFMNRDGTAFNMGKSWYRVAQRTSEMLGEYNEITESELMLELL